MNHTMIAVVIPYFKIDYFESCLSSLANQTDKRFKVYIGNDCSPSNPSSIIGDYEDKLSITYLNYDNNLGGQLLSSHWDRILKEVEEEWFLILGDDDELSEDYISKFYTLEKGIPSWVNVIKTRPVYIDGEGNLLYDLYKDKFADGIYDSFDFAIKKIRGSLNGSLGEHIFRTIKYKSVGFKSYPLAWHTDDMFFVQMSDYSRFYFLSGAYVLIRVFEGSISGSHLLSEKKFTASKMYIMDLAKSILYKGNLTQKRDFLKGIRQRKYSFSLAFIKAVYYKFGIIGRLYYYAYSIKLLIKKMIPNQLLKNIQP